MEVGELRSLASCGTLTTAHFMLVCCSLATVKFPDGVVVPPAPPPRRAPPALIAREDSFDRPDSPLFHETLPLPAESAIRRHRQRSRGRRTGASSASSSESDGAGDAQRGSNRRQQRQQKYQRRRRAASAGARSRQTRSTVETRLLVRTGGSLTTLSTQIAYTYI